jgi:xanthine dehydrogenase accessory factor
MLVYPDGKFIGTVGGGDLEHRVLDEAWMAMGDGQPRTLSYRMSDPARGDPGVCGGTVEVFVEPILPPAMVVVIGAGHVGKAVVYLAKWLGFRVAVSDDRAEFCNPEVTPGADAYYPVEMGRLPEQLKINRRTFIVITSRGSGVDALGLPALLDTNPAYIGVIGSRRRWLTTVKALKARGVSEERIAQVHSPMGLELNAETPEEIAVSIMAEILMVRDKGTGKPMKMEKGRQADSQKVS